MENEGTTLSSVWMKAETSESKNFFLSKDDMHEGT